MLWNQTKPNQTKPHFSDLQNLNLTIRCSLISLPRILGFFKGEWVLPHCKGYNQRILNSSSGVIFSFCIMNYAFLRLSNINGMFSFFFFLIFLVAFVYICYFKKRDKNRTKTPAKERKKKKRKKRTLKIQKVKKKIFLMIWSVFFASWHSNLWNLYNNLILDKSNSI